MAKSILPDSISKALHLKVLDEMVETRFADLDTNCVLINLIDSVPSPALPFLAIQFNVSGYKGWKFADTEQKQRDLLKRAIELNRYKGTPYGIKEALKLAGVIGAIQIQERVTLTYNGDLTYNGVGFYGNHWAYFRVLIGVANLNGLSLNDVREVVLEYKNARSWLIDVSYFQDLSDTITAVDSKVSEIANEISEVVTITDGLNTRII